MPEHPEKQARRPKGRPHQPRVTTPTMTALAQVSQIHEQAKQATQTLSALRDDLLHHAATQENQPIAFCGEVQTGGDAQRSDIYNTLRRRGVDTKTLAKVQKERGITAKEIPATIQQRLGPALDEYSKAAQKFLDAMNEATENAA